MVLYCDERKLSRSLAKSARNKGYRVTADQAFADVLLGCSEPRKADPGTWLGKDMRKAYLALHRAGYAHSFETWRGSELVGGLYGVAIGRMFYGGAMFSRATDSSKVALVKLVRELKARNFPLIDCAMSTRHQGALG